MSFARKRYRPLFRELDLSDAESEQLLPVLDEQDRQAAKPVPRSRLATDGSILPDPERESRLLANHTAIAKVLGEERATKLDALRRNLSARSQMRMLRLRLDESEEPLTEEQQKLVVEASTASWNISRHRASKASRWKTACDVPWPGRTNENAVCAKTSRAS